jgi:myo-inositol-1(or 4)-monophosphatase
MTPSQLDDARTAAIEAARRAADILADYRPRIAVRTKARADLVTDADHESQKAIGDFLAQRFPKFEFLGEEDPHKRQMNAGDPPTWIVDPIDGTTNYIHDIPLYCVSIGLWTDGEYVVGVIYDPRHDEMFWAAQGQGAWLNERRIQVTATSSLEDALLSVGFPTDAAGCAEQMKWWSHFSVLTRGLRRTGSSALNMAYVAAGRFDAFIAQGNKIWDIAAGTCIVREAGGMVTRFRDTSFDPTGYDMIATNAGIHAAIQQELRNTR